MDDKYKNFGNAINRLIAGENLSRQETHDLFAQILNQEQGEIHQGAFLAAITAKGPSPEEIAGVWEALFDIDTVKVFPNIQAPLVDNCGTGMDSFKTFNISTASAIVGAAGGVNIARHGARAITSKCGTVDICESLGVDVECNADLVCQSIEKTGIGIFNGMSAYIHPHALFRILSQMSFGSILNIAASLANPASPEYGVRGVYSKEMISHVIKTMKEIGFKRAMVLHGSTGNCINGIDELSPVADSYVSELFPDGSIHNYTISPDSLGVLSNFSINDIAGGNSPEQEACRLIKIFNGMDKGPIYETVCLNSAPIFYIADHVNSLKKGVEKARDIIDSGIALRKLKCWITTQNSDSEKGLERFEKLMQNL